MADALNFGTRVDRREVRVFHLCCGSGFGAKGFRRGSARVGNMEAVFRNIGGVDIDPAGIRDFERFAGCKGTLLDLMSIEQYRAFHGKNPSAGWRAAMPTDIQAAAGFERPHIIFVSAPCKGFSGLLSERLSVSPKYAALNGLTLRAVWLALEAFKDDPVEFFLFENVPRIATRGRALLDQIQALFAHYGYAFVETTHDCGELGGLGQSRKRFLMVARHREKVPPFLYEPPKRRLRGVGEILGKLPLPGDERAGPMHRIPSLQWKTWVRLAFVEAGSDWRSLNKLRIEDGVLADYAILPESTAWRGGVLGVNRWDESCGVVAGQNAPTNGAFSVADPRPEHFEDRPNYGVCEWEKPTGVVTSARASGQGKFSVADPRVDGHPKSVQIGVRRWDEPAGVVTGKMFVGGGPNAVADPRLPGPPRFNNVFRIVRWDETSPAIAGPGSPAGGFAVADPRPAERDDYKQTKYRVTGFDEPAGTVIAASTTGNGAFCVADPRTGFGPNSHRNKLKVVGFEEVAGTITGSDRVGSGALSVADPRPEAFRDGREAYATGGHYGVVPWHTASGTVTGTGQHDNGRWSVADPRDAEGEKAPVLPAADDRLVAVIRALDGTWHRPFTTFELAALQSLFDPEEWSAFEGLDGTSDSAWRERIGNGVPPEAARAVADVMGRTLLLAWSGETFMLSADPIWVQPLTIALSVDVPEAPFQMSR